MPSSRAVHLLCLHHFSPPFAQHARQKMNVLATNIAVPFRPLALQWNAKITIKIDDKQLLTGEPCNETTVESFFVSEGGVVQEQVKVDGLVHMVAIAPWLLLSRSYVALW